MRGKTIGEMRMELAEHQREQKRLEDGLSEKCYGCVASGEKTARIPDDADSPFAGEPACAYHWPDEAGEFPA